MTKTARYAQWILAAALTAASQVWAQTQPVLVGDVGMAVYNTPPIARTAEKTKVLLPYVYADYGAFYARVDTFGYKLLSLGAGHLELATRISFEGYQPANTDIEKRERPILIGFGTFQETPYGAFILYGFRDTLSGGNLIDATYATEFQFKELHVYPQLGIERRDRRYVQSLYGVNASEAARSGLPIYSPGNSFSPNAAIAVEYLFLDDLKFTFQIRKKWLDKSIDESPLVNVSHQTASFFAISKTFK